MISRIEAYNYRCFRALSVDLDRYQVLAGANGAGKTTLLDIPVLIGDLLRPRMVAAFLERSPSGSPPRETTLRELLHRGQGDMIAFAIEAVLPTEVINALREASSAARGRTGSTRIRYELRLEVRDKLLRVVDEYLFLFSDSAERPNQEHPPQDWQYQRTPAVGNFWGLTDARLRSGWSPVIMRTGERATTFFPESILQTPEVPEFRVPTSQLALAAIPPDQSYFPAALWFVELLREGAVFYEPEWDELRRAAPPGDPASLIATGRNIPWLALELKHSDPDQVDSWIDLVRTALPQVANIRAVEREEDHYAYFSVDYVGGYSVTSSGLSDGTLRILALTLLPFLGKAAMPGLLVTEQPENGIHPRAIETVVQSLGSLYDSQVLVSTQSPQVLAHTNLDDVLVARIGDDGSVSVVNGREHPRLRDWHGSLDIGTTQSVERSWSEFAVIVIEPELEAWLWQDNPHVAEVFKCPPDFRKILAEAGHWPVDSLKPPDPKGALNFLRQRYKLRIFNNHFGELATKVSVRNCQDPAFHLLCQHLRTWFPER